MTPRKIAHRVFLTPKQAQWLRRRSASLSLPVSQIVRQMVAREMDHAGGLQRQVKP
jgi:hypothetical protein